MAEVRGTYGSAADAKGVLKRLGFDSLESALASVYPELEGPAMARRGDCGLVEVMIEERIELAGVVIMGDMVMGKAPVATGKGRKSKVGDVPSSSVRFWPRSKLVKAFRVGW
jgi:hypothetical protein